MSATGAAVSPFGVDQLDEQLLPRAPLIRVIAQARFPTIASVGHLDFIGAFQEALRPSYPILRGEQQIGVVISAGGVAQAPDSGSVWRFSDADGRWRVGLSPSFLSVDTSEYKNRGEFLGRFESALIALRDHIRPTSSDRIGVRFLNRIIGEDLTDLPSLVRPEALGLAALAFGDQRVTLRQSLTIAQFSLPAGQFQVRMGMLPPNVSADPGIEPASEESWLLDMDMFEAQPRPFAVESLIGRADAFSKQAYRFFRWVVTDELLRRSGVGG